MTCRNGRRAMTVEPLAFLLMLGTRLADMETDVSGRGKSMRHNKKNNKLKSHT